MATVGKALGHAALVAPSEPLTCRGVLMSTLVDYDAPRRAKGDDAEPEEPIRALATTLTAAPTIDDDPDGLIFDLPDSDLSGEEFTMPVIPKKANEFSCTSCFLVFHRNRMSSESGMCADCA